MTRSKVRRERMGHIDLAAPVSHIWFFKGVPSRIGYLIDMAPKELEKVLYFAASVITWVDETARKKDLKKLEKEVDKQVGAYDAEREQRTQELNESLKRRLAYLGIAEGEEDAPAPGTTDGFSEDDELWADTVSNVKRMKADDREKTGKELRKTFEAEISDTEAYLEEAADRLREVWKIFTEMKPKDVINDETTFRELKDRFGSPFGWGEYFRGGMGAESVRELLEAVELEAEAELLEETINTSKGQKQARAVKRLKVVDAFLKSTNRPDWMVLDVVPVIPPELRPMVQLDGGRFATSDLNDLYRRVINRNNRLKRLLDLGAPEIIVNNEKRMLQEAVDALFDNGRRGRPVTGPGNRPLKSLSDMLKGKQGRFRQNLLGKRVDYSGRSVIVSGPNLKIHQCGLPKLMALELFKPFIMARLVERKQVQNIKAAKKMVDSMIPEVWDVLEEVIHEHPVLLNRAPTLHRLGIQAFEPVLVEGKAIQIHPLVCHAFNADFDGDQMAVHLPLSAEAQAEARILMLSSNNILSPAHGSPLATPTQDMVLGLYYLTYSHQRTSMSSIPRTARPPPASVPHRPGGRARLRERDRPAPRLRRVPPRGPRALPDHGRADHLQRPRRARDRRSPRGRVRPRELRVRQPLAEEARRQRDGQRPGRDLRRRRGLAGARLLQGARLPLRDSGRDHDLEERRRRPSRQGGDPRALREAERGGDGPVRRGLHHRRGAQGGGHRRSGTRPPRRSARRWRTNLDELNPIFMMANSGARGSFKQIRQLAGMRGLMANPKGEIIERPIKANFMEGLSVLEYFISTHGARKGLADTALRTADSGYLTRRLVDVAQDVIVRIDDCKTKDHIEMPLRREDGELEPEPARPHGRRRSSPTKRGRDLLKRNQQIDWPEIEDDRRGLRATTRTSRSRSARCSSARPSPGSARQCYGVMPATGALVEIGDAVGIIAAQSIGEPGTQLTMRTFHTGGVAGLDITQGLPRVVELFEARKPKGLAKIAEVAGKVSVEETDKAVKLTITDDKGEEHDYSFPARTNVSTSRRASRSSRVPSSTRARSTRPSCSSIRGRTETEQLHRLRGPAGLPLAGRRHQRQAHRADRPPDAEEGAGRVEGLDRAPARPARGPAHLRRDQREGQGQEDEDPGARRGRDPRDHQGLAGDGVLPLGRLLPGDDQGAHRRRARGQARPPHGPEGERDHRQADPGRDRAAATTARSRSSRWSPPSRPPRSSSPRRSWRPSSSSPATARERRLEGFGPSFAEELEELASEIETPATGGSAPAESEKSESEKS